LTVDGCDVVSSPDEAINLISDDEAFVIGGGQIYSEFLPKTSKLYITRVNTLVEGDTKFPEIDWKAWQLITATQGSDTTDPPFTYVFEDYIRI
jgi:dihydrofolate reductase